MDSCQDIIHFMRERLSCLSLDCSKAADFDKAHRDGFKGETEYRKEKGWPGEKTGCFAISTSPLKAECTYDDNGDGTTDRTEVWDFDNDTSQDITKVTCKPAK